MPRKYPSKPNNLLLSNEFSPMTEQILFLPIIYRFIDQKAIDSSLISWIKTEKPTIDLFQHIVEYIFKTARIDHIIHEWSLRELLFTKNSELEQYEDQSTFTNSIQVMGFPMVILYKTLPCPKGAQCQHKPREIAPYNQYSDEELSCFFYHSHKDKRRIPISPNIKDDFLYKANYDKKKDIPNNPDYSRNHFESIYHPIYYKLFRCKRGACKKSYYCPFNHGDAEKLIWDQIFQTYFFKKREVYTGKNYNCILKELTRPSFDPIDYCPNSPSMLTNNAINTVGAGCNDSGYGSLNILDNYETKSNVWTCDDSLELEKQNDGGLREFDYIMCSNYSAISMTRADSSKKINNGFSCSSLTLVDSMNYVDLNTLDEEIFDIKNFQNKNDESKLEQNPITNNQQQGLSPHEIYYFPSIKHENSISQHIPKFLVELQNDEFSIIDANHHHKNYGAIGENNIKKAENDPVNGRTYTKFDSKSSTGGIWTLF